jgi:hypothetical protein
MTVYVHGNGTYVSDRKIVSYYLKSVKLPKKVTRETAEFLRECKGYVEDNTKLGIKLFLIKETLIDKKEYHFVETNVWRLMKSLGEQKSLFLAICDRLKQYKPDANMMQALRNTLERQNERLSSMENNVIKEDMKYSYLQSYIEWLEGQGKTLYEDIEEHIEDMQRFIPTEEQQGYAEYVNKVVDDNGLSKEKSDSLILQEELQAKIKKQSKRNELVESEAKKQNDELVEELKEYLYGFEGRVKYTLKTLEPHPAEGMKHPEEFMNKVNELGTDEAWLLIRCNLKKGLEKSVGFVGENTKMVKSLACAKVFNSEEEMIKERDELNEKRKKFICMELKVK